MSSNHENCDCSHQSFLMGKSDNIHMPPFYIIEPTNWCNYSCSICPNRLYDKRERGFMSLEVFKAIIEQIRDYAKIIQLYWVGEPLLHPDIIQMITLCKKMTNARTIISTNGSLLTEKMIRGIIESGLDKIIVSMDAAESNDIYNQLRPNGSIQTLNCNVENLIKNIQVKHESNLEIELNYILTHINEGEKEAFVEKWKKYNVSVRIGCLFTWANQLTELNNMSDLLSPMIGKKRTPCSDLWYKMAIHWNGKVSRCCFDWSFKNVIGNVNTQSIFNIWNTQEIVNLRKEHANGEFYGLCAHCDAWATESEYPIEFG